MELLVKQYRQIKKLTQAELAKKSGVLQPVIADIEAGNTKNPRIDTVQAIAKAFGVSIDDLIAK